MAPTLLRRQGQQAVTSPNLPSKAAPMRMLGGLRGPLGDYSVARRCVPRVFGHDGRPVGPREQGPSEGSSIRPTGVEPGPPSGGS